MLIFSVIFQSKRLPENEALMFDFLGQKAAHLLRYRFNFFVQTAVAVFFRYFFGGTTIIFLTASSVSSEILIKGVL